MTYQAIADDLGYVNAGAVHRLVKQTLEGRLTEDIDHLRQVQDGRLMALLAAEWDQALIGHVPRGPRGSPARRGPDEAVRPRRVSPVQQPKVGLALLPGAVDARHEAR